MDISPEQIYVHAGTQNGSILGFTGTITSMENVYAYSPNQGSVKCVTTSGRFLITGGFDEIIRLYDLKQRKERGQLIGHEGTITCLRSYKNFVISGAEDSMIIIWKAKEWSLLFRLKGHKDSVYDMALHETGKILASVGKDKKIILWNMINGGKIFRKTMPFNTYKVKWAPEENLLIMSDKIIHLVSQENNKSMKEFAHPKGINDFLIIGNVIIVAGDEGNLYFWNNVFDVEQPSHYITFKAHTPRVKRIKHIVIGEKNYLVSCSTDGTICTWEIDEILANIGSIAETKTMEEDLKPLYSLYSYQRIITLDAHFADQITNPLAQPNAQAGNETNHQQQQQQQQNKEKQQQQQQQKQKQNQGQNQNQKKGDKKNAAEKQGKKIKKVQFAEPEQEKPKKQAEKKKMFSKEKVIKNQMKYQEKAQQHGKQKKQFGKKSNKDLGSGSKKRFGQKKLEVEYDD